MISAENFFSLFAEALPSTEMLPKLPEGAYPPSKQQKTREWGIGGSSKAYSAWISFRGLSSDSAPFPPLLFHFTARARTAGSASSRILWIRWRCLAAHSSLLYWQKLAFPR